MRRLNLPLIVALLVSALVLSIGVHFLHAFQVGRNSTITLEQARDQKEKGELARSLILFEAYLKQNPDDAEVYVEEAKVAVSIAELPSSHPRELRIAYDKLSSAAARNPDDRYVREQLAKYEVQMFGKAGLAKAIRHYEKILELEPNDKQIKFRLAQLKIYTANHVEARQTLLSLIGYDPKKKEFDPKNAQGPELIEAYSTLAESLRDTKPTDEKLAEKIIQQMVDANPKSAEAYLSRAVWNENLLSKRSDRPEEAKLLKDKLKADLNDAYKIAPQDINVLSQKLKWSIFDKDFDESHKLLAQGLKDHSLDPAVYLLAADLAGAERRADLVNAETTHASLPDEKKLDLEKAEKHAAEAITYLTTGVERIPKNFNLRFSLVERLMEKGDFTAARKESKDLSALAAGDFARWQSGYVDAQLEFFLEKNYQRAAGILDLQKIELEAKKQPTPDPRLVDQLYKVYTLLARCYELTGQSDQMLDIFNRLGNLIPGLAQRNVTSEAGLAKALMGLGRRDEAIAKLRDLHKHMSPSDFFGHRELWLQLLSALVADQSRLPKHKRDWKEIEDLFAEMKDHKCQSDTERIIWRSDLYAQQGELDKARETLEAQLTLSQTALAAKPKDEELLARNESLRMAAINFEAMQGHWAEALAAVDEALARAGDKVNFRLRKAEILLRQNDQKTLEDNLKKLELDTQKFSVEERVALDLGLSVAHWRRGKAGKDDSKRLLKTIIELKPLDGRPYAMLFRNARDSHARDSKDPVAYEEVTEAADGLKRLLGANAREWKLAEATRLMMQYDQDRAKYKENLIAVRQLLRDLEKRSPGWPETDKLEAGLARAEGNSQLYYQKLEAALKHGPADSALIQELIPELRRQKRHEDIRQLLDRVAGENQPVNLEKIGVEERLRDDGKEAVKNAEELVAGLPEDSENYRWLADVSSRAGQDTKATEAYRKAISLSKQSPDPRLGLIQHLMRFNRADLALAEIQSMEAELPPENRSYYLARGYQLVGDEHSALDKFEEALHSSPGNLTINSELVNYYRAVNQPEKAESLLEKTLAYQGPKRDKEDEYRTMARRLLVQIRAPRTNFKDLRKALELLDQNARNGQLPDEDIYLKARVLGQRLDSDSRRKAIVLLEDLVRRKKLTNEADHLLLATLDEEVGRWDESQKIISSIVAKHNAAIDQAAVKKIEVDAATKAQFADALSLYTTLLFEHNQKDTAAGYLEKLNKLQPDAPRTISLRARLLAKQGKAAAAKEELVKLIPERPLKREQEVHILEVANSLRALQLYHEAQAFYEEYYSNHPEARLMYADYLGHHSDLNAAFDLCDKAIPSKDDPAYLTQLMNALQVAVSTLRARQALVSEQHYDRVEKWIEKGLKENPGFSPLELKKAELLDLRGRYAEVEAIYRRIIKMPTKDADAVAGVDPAYRAIALNNLAYLMAIADPPKGDEALAMINEVIELFGPQKDFLDTRAMCYLARGEVSKALTDLNDVLLDHNSKDLEDKTYAMKYFHMALALHRNQDDKGALQSLNKARELGLTPADFPIRERPMFERLQNELATKKAKPAAEAKDAPKSGDS